jgi:flagellar export protein FliJ
MKRFRFSLQALQTLRQQQEQVALERYAQAVQAHEQVQRQRETVQRELETGWRQRQQQWTLGTTASECVHAHYYCLSVEARLRVIDRQLQAAQNGVRQCWDKLLQARQRREVVEQCHERQRRRYDLEIRWAEQKVLDEMANRPTTEATASKMNLNELLW